MSAGRVIRASFQGELGAFSEDAVRAFFGTVEPVPCRQLRDVGLSVLSGEVPYGVVPVENSLAGTVQPAYDVLAEPGLCVVGEVVRRIRHHLLGLDGVSLEELQRVHSHPVALAQCAVFFAEHPALEAVAVYDTAGAAQEVAARRDATVAAIAGQSAADRYGLTVLARDIQDRADNQTRFLVIARADAASASLDSGAPGPWRSSVLVETENRPGALAAVLQPLAAQGINLSKLESRPGIEPFTYRFFLEFEADAGAPATATALTLMRRAARSARLLGSFPRWTGPID